MGKIKPFLIFMSLIIIHEFGHFMAAKLCGWKTEKIELYPYGGISKFQTFVNVPIKQEVFVLLMGPIMQIVFVYGCSFLLSVRNMEMMMKYHNFLLCFNLLPIYPLDGGRLVHLVSSRVISFQKSFYIGILISYLTLILIGIYSFCQKSIFFVCVLFFLALKVEKERTLFPFVFHKFLLERVLYTWNFKRKIVIRQEKEMRKDAYHLFKKEQHYYDEKEYLTKFMIL